VGTVEAATEFVEAQEVKEDDRECDGLDRTTRLREEVNMFSAASRGLIGYCWTSMLRLSLRQMARQKHQA